ncbi:MAG: ABC transporter ATP-binding protein [Pseudomonadota bacterium]
MTTSRTARADEPLLEVEDLSVSLRVAGEAVRAVDGVSFCVNRGETLGIVGESGSGKSMTASAIMGILPDKIAEIESGSIKLDGEDLLVLGERAMQKVRGRRIGMILQDPHTSLNPVFSSGEQIGEVFRMQAQAKARPSIKQRVVDALRDVHIAAPDVRSADFPHQMSGGMKQRVVGAIALAGDPDLVIADEPTTALDVTVQSQYLKLLKELQRERNIGMIFITHDFGVVARICDKVAVMYAGRIVEAGDVRTIFRTPAHPYTQALLATVPSVDDKPHRLPAIEGQPPSLFSIPEGCSFAPRCPKRMEMCSEAPPMLPSENEPSSGPHGAACWLLKDS